MEWIPTLKMILFSTSRYYVPHTLQNRMMYCSTSVIQVKRLFFHDFNSCLASYDDVCLWLNTVIPADACLYVACLYCSASDLQAVLILYSKVPGNPHIG